MKRFQSKIIGIDLGTTNTLAAYYDELAKKGECIVNLEGTNLLPSAVSFDTKDSYTVGKIAKEGALLYPKKTAMYYKRKMGTGETVLTVDHQPFLPENISSLVLKELLESVENDLEEKVNEAVLTVPVYFGTEARKATKLAAEAANLKVRAIITEPEAAICHAYLKHQIKGNVLVFDLGGGTFDLLAAKVSEKEIDGILNLGDLYLGGSDWDKALFQYVKDKYLKGKTLGPDDEQELLLKIEKAKIILSKKEKTRLAVSTMQGRVEVEITLNDFHTCTKHLLDRVRTLLQDMMKELSQKSIHSFDKIILVGGATRMVQIKNLLKEYFPQTEQIDEGDEAVVKGAAVYGKWLSEKKLPVQFMMRSTKSYGISCMTGENSERKICNIICRMDALPMEKKQIFYTRVENQNIVRLKVYENTSCERMSPVDKKALLGTYQLEIPSDLPKGSEIEVTLKLKDGILSVYGLEPRSGKHVTATIQIA